MPLEPVVNKSYAFNLPSPYQAELSRIADQQRMAQMLQAQSQQPTERFSYKGIEARTPVTAGLAKMLQGLSGAYFQNQAREQERALGERYRQEGMDDITRFAEMAGRPAVAATPGSEAFMPTGADYEDRGGAPAFKLDEQGMVPAVDPVAARMRGQIDPSMIGQFKTPEMQRMALAQMLKQGELPAAFNLGAEETRFQPPVGGGPPIVVARGAAKPLPSPFSPIDVSKFTPESVAAATRSDGTVDITKLVAIQENRTGDLGIYDEYVRQAKASGMVPIGIEQFITNQRNANRAGELGVYDEYVRQEKLAGRVPKNIERFQTDQKIAGRTPAAARENSVYDQERGGMVNRDTGVFTPATQDGVPLGPRTGASEKSLRDEYNNLTSSYRTVRDAYEKIKNVAPTGAGDMSLLYSFVKLLDPGSVVRESEFATAAASGSFGERVQGAMQRVLSGQRLSDSLRSDFVREADNLYNSQRRGADSLTKSYTEMAQRMGLNVSNVIVNYSDRVVGPPIAPIAPMRAKNPTTGEERISTDGGKTWKPAGRN